MFFEGNGFYGLSLVLKLENGCLSILMRVFPSWFALIVAVVLPKLILTNLLEANETLQGSNVSVEMMARKINYFKANVRFGQILRLAHSHTLINFRLIELIIREAHESHYVLFRRKVRSHCCWQTQGIFSSFHSRWHLIETGGFYLRCEWTRRWDEELYVFLLLDKSFSHAELSKRSIFIIRPAFKD